MLQIPPSIRHILVMRKHRRKGIHRSHMGKRHILSTLSINKRTVLPLRFRPSHQLKRNTISNGSSTTNLNRLTSKATTTSIRGHRITNSHIRRHMVSLWDIPMVLRRPARCPFKPHNILAAQRCINLIIRQPQQVLLNSVTPLLATRPRPSRTREFNPW